MAIGSPASRGSAQLLLPLIFFFAWLHLSRAQSPTASPPAPDEDASPPAPAPAPVENAFPPAVSPAAVGSPFSFTFDFSKASTSHVKDLKFEGDAAPHLHPDLIDATCDSFGDNPIGCVGRVSYAYPVPFYDDLTDEVASFQTSFTFSIKGTTKENIKGTTKENIKGDGMTFFIAYYPSAMPLNSGGGYLGLMDGNTKTAFGAQQFLAVEFDTYKNQWDTDSEDHIGIDINSVQSVNTTPLDSFGLNGYMTATVTFKSTTRMLVADLQFNDAKNNRLPVQVSWQLAGQLKNLLPAQAAVGFSAATGLGAELHQILSWSFSSSLASPNKGFTSIIFFTTSTIIYLHLFIQCNCWEKMLFLV